MFNLGFTEMLIVGVIILIFIGPNEIPELARTFGRFLNEMRRASDQLKGDLGDSFRQIPRDPLSHLSLDDEKPRNEIPPPATSAEANPKNPDRPKGDETT